MADGDGIDYLDAPKGCIHVILLRYEGRHTFECPLISPVDEPVSNMNAWPNLYITLQPHSEPV